ncbi:MAG: site-specific integrase [Gammaproteobacteria bacterium]|nr:site-specific integrase [Gammaproteobacteria bacterium]
MIACPRPLFDSLAHFEETSVSAATTVPYPQDFHYSHLFLKSYMGSQGTFNSYRREIERLLHWSWVIHHSSIASLKREDIEAFVRFCQSPPPQWVGLHKVNRFIPVLGRREPNAQWRPFVVTISKVARKRGQEVSLQQFRLSEGALTELFAILSTFFNFLVSEEYVSSNPVALIRQKSKFIRKRQQQAPIRRLSLLQWEKVLEVTEELAQAEPEKHERTRFMLTMLFGMYLRISELAASERWVPCMNHFSKDSQGYWWFVTVGKGNKQRQIAVSDAMLASLARWRVFLGMTPMPSVADQSPLFPKLKGQGPVRDTASIRRLVQRCFDLAEAQLRGVGQIEEADALSAATVHWLRHTGISEDVKMRPREHVRDDAGHSSSATTDRYIDIELAERYRSAKDKII